MDENGTALRQRVKELRFMKAGDLSAHPLNPRSHPATQKAALEASLESVGIADCLLSYVREDGTEAIWDGHLRRERNPEQVWPVLVTDLTEAEARQMMLTLDPLAAMAELHAERHKALLALAEGDRLAGLINPGNALDILLGRGGGGLRDGADADAIPEEVEQRCSPGDLWLLGEKHRLLCGDCTDAKAHDRLLAGVAVSLVLTDPPYGVKVDYDGYEDSLERLPALIDGFLPLVRRWPVVLLTPGIPAMWSYPRPDWVLAWVHPAPTSSGPWGFNGLNPVLAYGRDPYLSKGLGRRPDHCVLAATREGVVGHPTPKPAKVWEWLMERGSVTGDEYILDCFVGSGTSFIAGESIGRKVLGIELSPRYCDVTIQRFEQATGKEAVRLEAG